MSSVAHSSPGASCIVELLECVNLRFNLRRGAYRSLWSRCQAPWRCCKISYSRTAAAAR